MRFTFALISAVALAGVTTAASARDYISIAGSSTVLPFATIVAEQLGKLVEVGETEQMFTTPQHEMTQNYITGRFG
tara:strand:- start:316 stop:543 length:228 start_codon:yes stop_codon:yes gene_type:complete